MSRPYINVELRRLVSNRAEHICEYCLVSEADRSSGCQVDHIISVKHGGATTEDNLCYALQTKPTFVGFKFLRRFFNSVRLNII